LIKIILIFLGFFTFFSTAGDKNPITEKIKSDIKGIFISVSYDSNYSKTDYITEAYTSLSDTDKYVTDRGLDTGLIYFPCSGVRQKTYDISKDIINKVIKTKYEMDVYDRTDFIFTSTSVIIIHTSASNAGVFTGSEYMKVFVSVYLQHIY